MTTRYTVVRDLAKYRHNTQRWMRAHRTFMRLPAPQPAWLRERVAKDLTGWTEGELREAWGR